MYITSTIFPTYDLRLFFLNRKLRRAKEKISVILATVDMEVLKSSIEISIKISCISGNLYVFPLNLLQIF